MRRFVIPPSDILLLVLVFFHWAPASGAAPVIEELTVVVNPNGNAPLAALLTALTATVEHGDRVLDEAYIEACRTLGPVRLLLFDLRVIADTFRILAKGQGL